MDPGGEFRCACGAEVAAEDVLVTAYDLRAVGPSYLYVKFRCSRCGRLGEHRIEQTPAGRRHTPAEADDPNAPPPISAAEVEAFRDALARPGALNALLGLPAPEEQGRAGDGENGRDAADRG